jgi:hypothetical protein
MRRFDWIKWVLRFTFYCVVCDNPDIEFSVAVATPENEYVD